MNTEQSMGIKDSNAREQTAALSPKAGPTAGGVAAPGVSLTPAQQTPTLRYPFRVLPDRLRGGFYIVDAQEATICGDFDTEAVAALLAHNLNSHAALVAKVDAMQFVVNAASILEAAWNNETADEDADTGDEEMALWDAVRKYRDILRKCGLDSPALHAAKVQP